MPAAMTKAAIARAALATALWMLAPMQLRAQTAPSTTMTIARPLCFRGAPADRCDNYVVFDAIGAITPNFLRRDLGGCSQPTECTGSSPQNGYWAWELGAMHNVRSDIAAGAQLQIGAGSRSNLRIAPQVRGRRWLTRTITVDASAGPLWQRDLSNTSNAGLTGEAVLGVGDLFGLSLGGDAFGSPLGSSMYVGIRTESYASILGSLVVAGGIDVAHIIRTKFD